jgi:hypothetical protein
MATSINIQRSLDGYIQNGLIDVSMVEERHRQLVEEMKKRGYNHKSPIPPVNYSGYKIVKIDVNKSLNQLTDRCKECKENNETYHAFKKFLR